MQAQGAPGGYDTLADEGEPLYEVLDEERELERVTLVGHPQRARHAQETFDLVTGLDVGRERRQVGTPLTGQMLASHRGGAEQGGERVGYGAVAVHLHG